MLIELKVKDFAIIENLDLSFGSGLNILSGETGAGKSVLLKSLGLLMGEKTETDIVRSGIEQAVIEGYFDLSERPDIVAQLNEMGLDGDDQSLVVRRVVSRQGKSKVYLNGALSPLAALRSIVAPLITMTGRHIPLIEMTGQHDNRHLHSKAYHLELLDQFSGTWQGRQDFEALMTRYQAIIQEIAHLEEAARSRDQRLDFLYFQRDEIGALNLSPGEDEDLEVRIAKMRNSSRLMEFVNQGIETLYSGDDAAMVGLHHVIQRALELKNIDPDLENKLRPLIEAKALIEEGVYELREYGKSLTVDSEELSLLEERLSALRKLQKKFGKGIEEILNAQREILEEIEQLERHDENIKSLERERDQMALALKSRATDLHKQRIVGAERLTGEVNDELGDLNMKGVIFSVHVAWLDELTLTGQSDVEFMIQVSKKDSPKPIRMVASGGELSRILLALKRVVGATELPRTYLFDEVDTGVSGQTAEKVGRKLKNISKGQQLICVTHLPQVASFADQHFLIEKSAQKSGNVKMTVSELTKSDRVHEIARLISGEKISQASLEHARQLIKEGGLRGTT